MKILIKRAYTINTYLEKYLEIHNAYIKQTNSLLSIIKPINFSKFARETHFLYTEISTELENIKGVSHSTLNEKQLYFLETLIEYTQSLKNTIHQLFVLLKALENKAHGGKLSFSDHQSNGVKYQEGINEYEHLGHKLNSALRDLT